MSDKPEIGAGDVKITLQGETVTLRPTPGAAKTLSRIRGGISNLVEPCVRNDFDIICAVIRAGLGKDSKDLEDRVWQAGLAQLATPCIEFLMVLVNGGRPPKPKGEAEGETGPLAPTG